MKTKHAFISVLMILAMMTTLVVVAAAPASAAITAVGFNANPATAATAAIQTVTFAPSVSLTPGVDQITVTFPTGATVPASIAKANVAVQVNALGYKPLLTTDPEPAISGNSVTVLIPAAAIGTGVGGVITGGTDTLSVKFFASAGIKNPTVAKAANTYVGYVATTAEAIAPSTVYSAITTVVTFSPAQTTVGATVTVSGLGFTPNTSVDITGGAVGAGTVDATGAFVISATAAVTLTAITATDGAGVANSSATTILLLPLASLSPSSGLTGSVFDVTVSGLVANGTYGIGIAGTSVAVISTTTGAVCADNGVYGFTAVTADSTGKFIARVAMASGQSAGPKVINVRLSDNSGASATATSALNNFTNVAAWNAAIPDKAAGTFTVDARTLTGNVSSGFKGDTVILTGAGFEPTAAGSVVTAQIVYQDSLGASSATLLTTPASVSTTGTFQASVVVPATAAAGTGRFIATSSINGTATASTARATYTIQPASISVSPTTGVAGTELTVTMQGLSAYATYNSVLIDSATTINFSQSVVTDANGSLSAKFIWPGLASGPHTFVVTGLTPVASFTQTAGSVTVVGGLASVVSSLVENYVVWSFDNQTKEWLVYDTTPGAPANTLTSLTRGASYYFQVSEDTTLTYGGNSYSLYTGWNSIGWLG